MFKKPIIFVMPLVLISMVIGIVTGWVRIGWQIPVPGIAEHGAMMVGSFLGTVICVERVVTFKNKLYLIIPFLNGLSLVFLLRGETYIAYSLLVVGSLGLCLLYTQIIKKSPEIYQYVMLAGAVCWLVGNLFLVNKALYPFAVPWWIAFLLLTICGERLELSKFLPVPNHQKYLFLGFLGLFILGCVLPWHGAGRYLGGISLGLAALWLLQYDMAMKAVKKPGLHRYSGALLISGYFWLLISGVFLCSVSLTNPFLYDAFLHAFFLGFVISMVFAHGPIILPGVLGFPFKPFHNILVVYGVVLQLSIITRVLADFMGSPVLRQWSGIVNGIVILTFFITMPVLMKREIGKQKRVLVKQ